MLLMIQSFHYCCCFYYFAPPKAATWRMAGWEVEARSPSYGWDSGALLLANYWSSYGQSSGLHFSPSHYSYVVTLLRIDIFCFRLSVVRKTSRATRNTRNPQHQTPWQKRRNNRAVWRQYYHPKSQTTTHRYPTPFSPWNLRPQNEIWKSSKK